MGENFKLFYFSVDFRDNYGFNYKGNNSIYYSSANALKK